MKCRYLYEWIDTHFKSYLHTYCTSFPWMRWRKLSRCWGVTSRCLTAMVLKCSRATSVDPLGVLTHERGNDRPFQGSVPENVRDKSDFWCLLKGSCHIILRPLFGRKVVLLMYDRLGPEYLKWPFWSHWFQSMFIRLTRPLPGPWYLPDLGASGTSSRGGLFLFFCELFGECWQSTKRYEQKVYAKLYQEWRTVHVEYIRYTFITIMIMIN